MTSKACRHSIRRKSYTLALKAYMLKIKYFPYVLLLLSQNDFAASSVNSGGLMQQLPPISIQKPIAPEVNIEQDSAPPFPNPEPAKIIVNRVKITGEHAYSEADLIAVSGFKPKSELTLAQLRMMALKIAQYYHRNGYFVAQVYLPAQDIKLGIVTIVVIEGHYGKITLHNQTNLSDNLVHKILSGLNEGDLIDATPLENRLLLLSDLPGVKIKSTLAPGASSGSSDLLVNIAPLTRLSGSADADNSGNRYTGNNRLGATANLNNPLGLGDVASLRALTSGAGLNYVRASYQLQWGITKLGVSYSELVYALGQEFESLQANGSANVTSVYGSYPLIRSRNNNLYIQLDYDARTFQDKVDSTFSVTDKQAHVLIATLNGDHRDNFGGGGSGSYAFTWTTGIIDIQTPDMLSLDAATVQTNGNYNKLGFNAMRLQSVTDSTSLYASINGQIASKNLDISEKMELGGMYAVRAYPEGEAYADQGYVLTLEARKQIFGQMQFIGFLDTGTVTTNKNPWLAEQNSRTLSGAGIGINWMSMNSLVLKMYYARKLGDETATSAPDTSGRFWMQAVKYF